MISGVATGLCGAATAGLGCTTTHLLLLLLLLLLRQPLCGNRLQVHET